MMTLNFCDGAVMLEKKNEIGLVLDTGTNIRRRLPVIADLLGLPVDGALSEDERINQAEDLLDDESGRTFSSNEDFFFPAKDAPWFDTLGNCLRWIPDRAVLDCTRPGQDADKPVKYWTAELGFSAPRDLAIEYLLPFGAWEEDDLAKKTDAEISEIVFWNACCETMETGDWIGLRH